MAAPILVVRRQVAARAAVGAGCWAAAHSARSQLASATLSS